MSARKPPSILGASATLTAIRSLRKHELVVRELVKSMLAGYRGPVPDEQRRALEAIEAQAASMGAVIDDLDQTQSKLVGVASLAEPTAALQPHPRVRLLVAEDDEDTRALLGEILADKYSVILASDGGAALAHLQRERFDLALVDVQLPVLDGFQLAERLKENGSAPMPPFMFLSAQGSPEFKVRGLSLGAADYMAKPFDSKELLARIARILAASTREENLRVEALTDSLTGLANYRSFSESLEREFERASRYDHPLALLTVDLDHLKTINDQAGHPAGNDAICLVAQVLREGVRRFELVGRHGGDEFGVLLPNTGEAEALTLSERLRARLATHRIRGLSLSMSVGIAARERGSNLTVRELVEKSDRALYLAKRAGRNRVSSAGVPRKPTP